MTNDHAGLWTLYEDDDQKNVGDKSKHNAPDWESPKGRFSTLVDPVEDEHLVQIEDHPERHIDERENPEAQKSKLSGWQLSTCTNFPDEMRKSILQQKNA